MDLFNSYTFGSQPTMTKQCIPEADPHQNLIRLLQVAQSLKVTILPLTYNPGLEVLGLDGATSAVNQSELSPQTEFAFKRFRAESLDPDMTEEKFREMQYNAMIAEVTILGCQAIRSHPNIVTFIGLGFEVARCGEQIWPALVFSKAQHGDLSKFVSESESLGIDVLLSICGEVAKGLQTMHSYGIIHGDIKPANVLVFDNAEQSAIEIKIADFGFSCFGAADEDDVQLSKTEPWEAPEWDHRYWSVSEAKQMDVYSFGLLCLWLLFTSTTLGDYNLSGVTLSDAFLGQNHLALAWLQSVKMCGGLLQLAEHLVEKKADIDDTTRAHLRRVFALSLVSDPQKRSTDMGIFVRLLCEVPGALNSYPISSPSLTVPDWHGEFKAGDFFFSLDSCDFRVHLATAEALTSMANGEGCQKCTNNTAFQLSLCYSFGFCVTASDEISNYWLMRCNKTPAERDAAFHSLVQANAGDNVNANLSRLGYRSDLMNAYEWDGVLEKAIYHYRNMLRSRDKFFGPAHDSTIRIRSYLVDTLKRDNQLQEAIQHAQENIKYGVKHTGCRDCLTLKSQLAGLYASVGQLDKAETLTRAIIGEYQTSENDDHPTRLYDQNNLAFIFIAQAKFDKGLELALNVERECLIRLGVRHASTLEARKTVAIAYDACDELETAVDVSQMLLETRRSCVPVDHPLLVDALVSLGIQCYRLGRYDDALECYNDIKASMNRKPELGAIAVVSVANYASGLMRRSKIGEAVEILESLVEESEKYLGENNKIVIAAMGNLAFAYSKLEQYAKAEALAIRVLDLRRKTFPENHPHAITALKNLSHVLIVQSKWAESARLGLQELNILESIAATPESDKIVLGLATARYFIYGKCWNEAHCLLARVLTWQKSCHSEGEPIEYLSATILSTVCSLKLGHLNTIREEVLEILKALQIPFKEDPNELLSYLVSLGKRCMEENFTKEAGQVFGGSFILATQLPGVLPPVKAMLSTSISKYIQNHPTFEEYLVFNPAVLDFNI